MLEEAEGERDLEIRKRLLTFVVAGGGFSGIRCIAEMNEFLREAVSVYHNIAERDLRLVLLQRSDRILPEVTASLASFAHKLLVKRDVEIRIDAELKAVTANAVTVEDKRSHQLEIISTRTRRCDGSCGSSSDPHSTPIATEQWPHRCRSDH